MRSCFKRLTKKKMQMQRSMNEWRGFSKKLTICSKKSMEVKMIRTIKIIKDNLRRGLLKRTILNHLRKRIKRRQLLSNNKRAKSLKNLKNQMLIK